MAEFVLDALDRRIDQQSCAVGDRWRRHRACTAGCHQWCAIVHRSGEHHRRYHSWHRHADCFHSARVGLGNQCNRPHQFRWPNFGGNIDRRRCRCRFLFRATSRDVSFCQCHYHATSEFSGVEFAGRRRRDIGPNRAGSLWPPKRSAGVLCLDHGFPPGQLGRNLDCAPRAGTASLACQRAHSSEHGYDHPFSGLSSTGGARRPGRRLSGRR